ncbi:hypothetical protein SDC9_177205 [bioreactor metagenome]|uniref:Uncharacterized protein n=1 Tax=bioreactor metagenome TaxID=1076179 RepID=A0A645GUT9_9ZZZZ
MSVELSLASTPRVSSAADLFLIAFAFLMSASLLSAVEPISGSNARLSPKTKSCAVTLLLKL